MNLLVSPRGAGCGYVCYASLTVCCFVVICCFVVTIPFLLFFLEGGFIIVDGVAFTAQYSSH